MRTTPKALGEAALVRLGVATVARSLSRPRPLVLAFHDVVPDDVPSVGDASLHLPLGRFRALIDVLQHRADIVDLGQIIQDPGAAAGPVRVALTFDDAYSGALTLGLAELARRGLPVTVFVSPGLLGRHAFWWDVLARPGGGGLEPSLRDRALGQWRGREAEIRAAVGPGTTEPTSAEGEPAIPSHARSATEEELRAAASCSLVRLASHTWSHPNLTRLGPRELGDELARPLAWLAERYSQVEPWISYPYGLSSPSVRRAARDAGYRAGFRIDGGRVRRRDAELDLPRLNVPAGLSPRGLELRLAGLLA
ncbi:MAG: polysaccharide deacetylase family protein [Gemmatimonadota bacterium]